MKKAEKMGMKGRHIWVGFSGGISINFDSLDIHSKFQSPSIYRFGNVNQQYLHQ